jgi:FAD/FMN-containing dehydrogenase
LLAGAMAGAAGIATSGAWRIGRAGASPGCPRPPHFPADIDLYRQTYQNWAENYYVEGLWTCAPRSPLDVVRIANWAHRNGYTVRPRGARHGWSPLTITADAACTDRQVLVDTTQHLTGRRVLSASPAAVRVEAGTSMLGLVSFLERHGLGFTTIPAVGNPTIGGVLAIGGHGAALPATGEQNLPGHTFGSLSNLVTAITAVVWNDSAGRYELRTFDRADPDATAFLVHLGRAFVTSVDLRVGANQHLRCVSRTDIPWDELFAAPANAGPQSMGAFVDSVGRAEAIWFPFTQKPWFKTWAVSQRKPASSRKVTGPYNYPFSDHAPQPVSDLAKLIIEGQPELVPTLGATEYAVANEGLAATDSRDIWGLSKNPLLYIRPTTLRLDECGFAVVTARSNLQRVVHEFAEFHRANLARHRANGRFPINGPLEIRACGLDDPADCGIAGAAPPAISPTTPREDHPEWDIAVWFNVLTFVDSPGQHAYYREVERFVLSNYSGDYATVRPEWSKGWAFTNDASWAARDLLTTGIPALHNAGRPADGNWDWAVATLDAHDPHRVFSNPFLDGFMP